MRIFVRNDKGRIFEANKVDTTFHEHRMAISYRATFDHLPKGTYAHSGIRYPDGHERWVPNAPQTIGWMGQELYVTGELVIG